MRSHANTKYVKTLLAAFLAGVSICMGAVAYCASNNVLFGSVIFSVGLYIVLVNNYALYTGAICYVQTKGKEGVLESLLTLIGNGCGALASGGAIRMTRLNNVTQKAESLIRTKADDSLISILILAIFCNFLIFYAVNSYKNNAHEVGKYLGILLCIPAFIISWYEHCVANMCYIALAWNFEPRTMLMLAVSILGNTIGGIAVSSLTRYLNHNEQ